MKTLATLLVLASLMVSCHTKGKNQKNLNSNEMENKEIINTAFFYLKNGKEKDFEKLRSRGNVLLQKYGARIERVIKPKILAAGEIELPDEIHFAVYPNLKAKQAFDNDPDFIQLKKDYVANSVEKMYGFISHNDENFEFYREIGDSKKMYGVALIYLNEGEIFKDQFAEYHKAACEIIPEFGAHFERFLLPFDSANVVLEQPNEIHRFYFESEEGLQQMVNDHRMQQLYPKRDEALRNLIFIMGEAIQ